MKLFIFWGRHNFICATRLCLGRVRPLYSFSCRILFFSCYLYVVGLFCHRSVTATSSWSHYMYHIFNEYNIIIFLFLSFILFFCAPVSIFSDFTSEYIDWCSIYGIMGPLFHLFCTRLLSWKHITIALC